ncbi:unnamed protein product [Caenorhabditis brenneri]
MIFEPPISHFPAASDLKSVERKNSKTSGIQLHLNREMSSMNKALGASGNDNKSTGLFESFKTKFSGSSNNFDKSSGLGIGSSFVEKVSNVASGPFKLSL